MLNEKTDLSCNGVLGLLILRVAAGEVFEEVMKSVAIVEDECELNSWSESMKGWTDWSGKMEKLQSVTGGWGQSKS